MSGSLVRLVPGGQRRLRFIATWRWLWGFCRKPMLGFQDNMSPLRAKWSLGKGARSGSSVWCLLSQREQNCSSWLCHVQSYLLPTPLATLPGGKKARWHETIQLNARDTWQGVGSLPLGAGTATTFNFIVQYLLQRASQDPCLQQLSSGRDLQRETAAQAIQVHARNIRVW